MSGVSDCRVLPNINFNDSDHRILVATWRLKLKNINSTQRAKAENGWDTSKLLEKQVKEGFELKLSNRFEALASTVDNAHDTDAAFMLMEAEVHGVAEEVLGPKQFLQKQRPSLSEDTLRLISQKKQAYATWQQELSSNAKRIRYKALKAEVKRAVRHDERQYIAELASKAEEWRVSNNTHMWAKQARLLGQGVGAQSRGKTADRGLLSRNGSLIVGTQNIIKEFEVHFAEVLGRNSEVDPEAMEQLISEVEQSLTEEKTSSMADPPSFEEVLKAVNSLRNAAAPGEDAITTPLLKFCEPMVRLLHRLILAVWKSERAPVAWKRALLIPLYKGKDDQQKADNYRGISLLSIPGKAYAMVIYQRLRRELDNALHEAQCGFRAGRATTDAMFTLRCIANSAIHKSQDVHMAFIDLTKAYDSVNREALFKVLRLYGGPPRS